MRTLPRPSIYLDRSVIRSVVGGDMRARDRAAICRLAAMVSEDLLVFCSAADVRLEIDRIPARSRLAHPREYAALQIFHSVEAGWVPAVLDAELSDRAEYMSLVAILDDAVAAAPLCRAHLAGIRDVIASESSLLLDKSRELEQRMEIRVFRPADYLSRWSTQLQLPS